MFALGIDWEWVGIIAAFWIGTLAAFGGLIWLVGRILLRRDERRLAHRPLARVYELDLHRARRRSTPHRYAHSVRTTHHGDIA